MSCHILVSEFRFVQLMCSEDWGCEGFHSWECNVRYIFQGKCWIRYKVHRLVGLWVLSTTLNNSCNQSDGMYKKELEGGCLESMWTYILDGGRDLSYVMPNTCGELSDGPTTNFLSVLSQLQRHWEASEEQRPVKILSVSWARTHSAGVLLGSQSHYRFSASSYFYLTDGSERMYWPFPIIKATAGDATEVEGCIPVYTRVKIVTACG